MKRSMSVKSESGIFHDSLRGFVTSNPGLHSDTRAIHTERTIPGCTGKTLIHISSKISPISFSWDRNDSFFGIGVFIFSNRTTREVPNISNRVVNFPIMPEILFLQCKYQILLYQNNPKYTWWNHLEFPVNVIIVVSERPGRINMSKGFENY